MTLSKPRFLLALALGFTCGCSSSSDKTEIGDVAIGANTFHVFREGPAAGAGVMTTFVIKPTSGDIPTAVAGWVGTSGDVPDSAQVAAVFDANDGDYDLDMTCPTPFDPASKLWFSVEHGDVDVTGSIALK